MRVTKVAKFQTLSFLGYQRPEGSKAWKIPDFINFRISRLRGLQRLQSFRLYHFYDIKVGRCCKGCKG